MPSLITGFEYDIFISYRHNDNRSGWVTEFVKNLQEELAATIKDPVSVYFDANPHDGLLQTHDVDASLKDKLKCLIFIPIISQTYCDPKGFAWKHEFLAFKKIAADDALGLKIKLTNGNVASRILPISIHELDASDRPLIESEFGGHLRGIEFIYRTSGVVRALKPVEEDAKSNLNHTFYPDQINKVARAIKELTIGIQNSKSPIPNVSALRKTQTVPTYTRKRIAIAAALICLISFASYGIFYFGGLGSWLGKVPNKSIAVLPFENMNNDPEQDYFSNGITEDILNHLVKIADLKVKSRTSTLQYKGTQKTMTEVGEELGVANIVEGSVRRVGDKVRIVVQLIDSETDVHLWSETYDRELKDVLALQSEIAIEIANALEARLTASEKKNIQKELSQNATAYDYYLKARAVRNKSNGEKIDNDNALLLTDQALKLDPNFSKAFALKATLWYDRSSFGVSQETWQDSAMYFSDQAIVKDPTSPDGYIVQARVHRYLGNLDESKKALQTAYNLAPNDMGVLTFYGYQLLSDRDEKGADFVLKSIENEYSLTDPEYYLELTNVYYFIGDVGTVEKLLKKSKSLSPGSVTPYINLAALYQNAGEYDKGIQELKVAEKINPNLSFVIDQLGWHYFLNNDYENAAKYWSKYTEIEAGFEDSTQTVPFRHRLGMAYLKLGRKKKADALFLEDLKIREELLSGKRSMGTWSNKGSVFYDMAVDYAYLGNSVKAVQCLDSTLYYEFNYSWGFHNDPIFSGIRQRDDFKSVIKKVDDQEAFMRKAFSNAINRREAGKELKDILK